jgi:cytochrome P450
MSTLSLPDPLRPAPGGLKGRLMALLMPFAMETLLPLGFRVLRALPGNRRLFGIVVATRYDEVREAFLNDPDFRVPYLQKLDVIMGNEPFFLGMEDTPDYRRDTAAMRRVVRIEDIANLKVKVEAEGERIVAAAGGRLEVVDALVRQITFDIYRDYFGVTDPPEGDLRVFATRLFEFQFADAGNDPELRKEVDVMAPALRRHIDMLMAERRRSGQLGDDVLGRCLAMNAKGEDGFKDAQIRSSLMGFIVGGPPQPPMVVPQAMEQLLRRPEALAGAQAAARANDDKALAGFVFEAMRFDPLAPALPRTATRDSRLAAGTRREVAVKKDGTVYVAFASAMMDERRVPEPSVFNPRRLPHEYIHFGYGLHQCFGIHLNLALLPLVLKPLLKRQNLRRAPGKDGHLVKRGAFADKLWVEYE